MPTCHDQNRSKLIKPTDVFLTTMKPQQKVVTAQDVQSCLYYLHVDSVDDYKLLQSEESDNDQPEDQMLRTQSYASRQTSIRRKPLSQSSSNTSSSQLGISPTALPSSQNSSQNTNGSTTVSRKPVNQGVGSGHMNVDEAPALPPRKLLGPRAMNRNIHSIDSSALRSVPERQNIHMRRWSEQPKAISPQLPPRLNVTHRKEMSNVSVRDGERFMEKQKLPLHGELSSEHCWDWERSWEQKRAVEAREKMAQISSEENQGHISLHEDTSILLIRRYNGEQWNVGKILNADTTHRAAGVPGSSMSIEIMTKAYSKFMDSPYLSEDSSCVGIGGNTSSTDEKDRKLFRRHFQVPGNPKRPNSSHSPELDQSQSFANESRSSFEHRQQNLDGFRDPHTTSSSQTSSSKGYVLQSPWSGFCEFSTGVAGRSLKCKHSYASTNPTFGPGMVSAPISELRFNLPSSKVFGAPAAKSQMRGTPREAKRASRFLGSHHRRTSSSYKGHQNHEQSYFGAEMDFEDRLDLSLGQEHAGGGFGGKQAKLGKLIVELEGLQMLDFVVAANMALWWKVYDRLT